MQLKPVRWNFIAAPIPRRPYRLVRKLLEKELANAKANSLSELELDQKIKIRERTKKVIKQKTQKEPIRLLVIVVLVILVSTVFVTLIII